MPRERESHVETFVEAAHLIKLYQTKITGFNFAALLSFRVEAGRVSFTF